MPGFQDILEIQQSMTVQNRRTVGQQVSRSGQLRVAQYLTAVPWVFTIMPHNYLYYPQTRNIIQAIDNLDRQLSERVIFNSTNLSWFTAYQGDIVAPLFTLNGTPTANTQTVNVNIGGTGSGYAVKAGDFVMIGGYTYKITANVLRTTSVVAIGLHRPLIGTPSSGATVYVGNDCSFDLVAESCPTYTLNPMTSGAFVQWDAPFVFRENIT